MQQTAASVSRGLDSVSNLIPAGKRQGWGLRPALFDSKGSMSLTRDCFLLLRWDLPMKA